MECVLYRLILVMENDKEFVYSFYIFFFGIGVFVCFLFWLLLGFVWILFFFYYWGCFVWVMSFVYGVFVNFIGFRFICVFF